MCRRCRPGGGTFDMHDAELDELRSRVDCRTVLELDGWSLDARESSKSAAKYRNGPARIVIVTHEGRGWFDPLNDHRGDVLSLAQYLWGGSIGHARVALRPLAGILPKQNPVNRDRKPSAGGPVAWTDGKPIKDRSPGWNYLTQVRAIPHETIKRASEAGVIREGIYGTIWALHRSSFDLACGWEMRGPNYKGFSKGGTKTVFRVGNINQALRVVVTEGFIDALSLATIEGMPETTTYISTGGGFGPETATLLGSSIPRSARLVAATDQGRPGEMLADRLEALASAVNLGFSRLRPLSKDWNDQLRESAQPLHGAKV